jgi:hypothetical protein
VEAVDVLEFEPSIATVARTLEDDNQHVLDAHNVNIHYGDAREWVLTTKHTYDLIVSEPSNPFRAGISALFTLEFYQAVAKHLNRGGLFVQWVQGYEVDADAIRTVLRTVYGAFPRVVLWHTESMDLMVMASADSMTIDVDRLRRTVDVEPFRTALPRAWMVSDVEGVLAHFLVTEDGTSQLSNVVGIFPNTDDQNLLEYAFARSVGTRGIDVSRQLIELATAFHKDRPLLSGESAANVDWNRVAELRPRVWLSSAAEPSHLPMPTPGIARRARAVAEGCLGRAANGYREWMRQEDQTPHDDIERLVVATGLSITKDPRALDLADELAKKGFDVESELVRAMFAFQTGDFEAAMNREERALAELRRQPFPLCNSGQQVINLTRQLVGARPRLAARAARALLAGPFAARSFEEARLTHAQVFADATQDPVLCVAALGPQRIFPKWEEGALQFRRNCLISAHDPLADEAARDLVRFQMATQAVFSTTVSR